jgi:formylglycine-generating enzyme required for sulfatase activity
MEHLPAILEKARETLESPDASLEELVEAEHRLLVSEMELAEAERQHALAGFRLDHLASWNFEQPELAVRHSHLAELVANLDRLSHPDFGLVPTVESRIAEAASLRHRSLEEGREAWDRAIASIADRADCPLYEGLRMRPQLGLLPLRRHPESSLWEFWLVASGERPEEDGTGEWRVQAETGLVLVLTPGGMFWMGAQSVDEQAPTFDPQPFEVRMTIHEVEIDPFFLSKYEMTQAQWARLCGRWPSTFAAGHIGGDAPQISRVHPVETIAWEECRTALRLWGLDLPSEAQWERAARCGSGFPFGPWTSFAELPDDLNCADESYARGVPGVPGYVSGRRDGWPVHAPVDRAASNPWGFLGVLGNVGEWVLDGTNSAGEGYGEHPHEPPDLVPGTGEHRVSYRSMDIYRGGTFIHHQGWLFRPADRHLLARNTRHAHLGARPMRHLDSD